MTSPIVLFLLSNLNVIVSEFYDLDVHTIKKIEIKPRRVQASFFGRGRWNLNKVQRCNLRLLSFNSIPYKTYITCSTLSSIQ